MLLDDQLLMIFKMLIPRVDNNYSGLLLIILIVASHDQLMKWSCETSDRLAAMATEYCYNPE